MTRDEHLTACKKSALELLDRGEVREAFTTMICDLRHHPETADHKGCELGVMLMTFPGWIDNPVEVRHWIEGFR